MAASNSVRHVGERPRRARSADGKLTNLSALGTVDIETPLVADLGDALRALFDPVAQDALPIYFGPLLGRLYLEGL